MGNYVNFHGADGQINSVVLNSFLPAVANTLNTKFSEICTSPKRVKNVRRGLNWRNWVSRFAYALDFLISQDKPCI